MVFHRFMKSRCFILFTLLILVSITNARAKSPFAKKGVLVTPNDNKISILIDGNKLTDYHYAGVERPFFWPVYGPNQSVLTRGYPVETGPGDATDHPHHTGLWFTHGDVNKNDFWHKTHIKHKELVEYTSGSNLGQFTVKNDWIGKSGEVVCSDVRTFTVHKTNNSSRIFEYSITIKASNGDVVFGDTKEGSMAIRLAPTMRVEGKVGKGSILNSAGVKDKATWGKRAKWVDYFGPVNDKIYGVTIMDHPNNPRHPTWWHVRTYGLFAANPFGIHDFEKKAAGTGDFHIKNGEEATFKYGFVLHEGKANKGMTEKTYLDWVK